MVDEVEAWLNSWFTPRISSAIKEDDDNNNCLRNLHCCISVDTGKFVGRFRILRVLISNVAGNSTGIGAIKKRSGARICRRRNRWGRSELTAVCIRYGTIVKPIFTESKDEFVGWAVFLVVFRTALVAGLNDDDNSL